MSITVALVDNQVLFRKGLKELLTSLGGIDVQIEADTCGHLASRLSKGTSTPDICVISSQAYLRNKRWSIRELKRGFWQMKIVVVSSSLHAYAVQILRSVQINGFLLKNATPKEFKKAIFTVNSGGSYWPKLPQKILQSVEQRVYSANTIRENHLQFLELCLTDMPYQEMSEKMGVSARTLEGYRDILFNRFKVNNRTSLVVFALQNGLIELN